MPSDLRQRLRAAPLYAILEPGQRPDRTSMAILTALLDAGVRVIQYRHKATFGRAQFEDCRAMAGRVHQAGGLFLVNDRADVAALCGADGVHLGQQDLPPEKARGFLGPAGIIGSSTHSREQALEAAGTTADYIAIGPIFATATKQNPDPIVGLEMVRAVRALTTKPLVGIGGITLENAASVLAAGADAIAVISDLLRAPDIPSRARQFLIVLRSEPQR